VIAKFSVEIMEPSPGSTPEFKELQLPALWHMLMEKRIESIDIVGVTVGFKNLRESVGCPYVIP
jgi:hypothetical protein